MKRKIIIAGIIILVSLLILGLWINNFLNQKKISLWLEKRKNTLFTLKDNLENEISKFGQQNGILIKDLKTGYKIGFNEDIPFPAASLIKVPIMACVYCAEKEAKIDIRQKVIIKNHDKTSGAGILKYVPEGIGFDIEELVRLMIVYSDNTATNILIDLLGFYYLNNCFKNLGLRDTSIYRKILDNQARKEGKENYTTAQDIGYILEMIYRKELISKEISDRCLEYLKQQKIHDRIPAFLPSSVLVAHKTGLENGVCHDAGIIFSKEGDFLICVLTQHRFKTARPSKQFIAQVAKKLYLAFNKDE
jgi:beta-lactamase class A